MSFFRLYSCDVMNEYYVIFFAKSRIRNSPKEVEPKSFITLKTLHNFEKQCRNTAFVSFNMIIDSSFELMKEFPVSDGSCMPGMDEWVLDNYSDLLI